jgi:hypothetical protein
MTERLTPTPPPPEFTPPPPPPEFTPPSQEFTPPPPPSPQEFTPPPPSSLHPHHFSLPPSQDLTLSKKSQDFEGFKFIHPFTMIISGPTMSGKSTWIKKVLIHSDQLISPVAERILWIYKRWQPLYDELKHWIPSIVFIQGITVDIKSDTVINSRKRFMT